MKKAVKTEVKQHPHDDRVSVVSKSRPAFVEAAKEVKQKPSAAILKPSDKARLIWRKSFTALDPSLLINPKKLKKRFSGTANGEEIKIDLPPDIEPLKHAFTDLMDLYHQITGEQKIRIVVVPNFSTNTHDHTYPVLNRCLGAGATWKTEDGSKKLAVGDSDYFFFDSGFKHESPEQKAEDLRISIVVRPDYAVPRF